MPYAFHFRGETVIYATLAPLLPPTLPRLRGSPEMQNIHNKKKQCEHSYTKVEHWCPILCDIRHFWKCVLYSVNAVTQNWNVDVQFSVTFVTFENVSCKVWTQLHRIETLISNSLWHSSLLKKRLLKCEHSYRELSRRCPILCDIHHFGKVVWRQLQENTCF